MNVKNMAREILNKFEGPNPFSLNPKWFSKVRTHEIMEMATSGQVIFKNGGVELRIPDTRESQTAVARTAVQRHNEAHDSKEKLSIRDTNQRLPIELHSDAKDHKQGG